MRGLLLKDLYNLRKDGKMVLLLIAFFIMIIFIMGNTDLFLSTIMLMLSATSITSFACDNQCKWDTYVNTLPVSRGEVVMSKYVLSFLLALAGSLLALLIGWINGMIKNAGSFTETLVFAYSLFAAAVILISILLPLVYKLGVERSRIIVIAVAVIPASAVFMLAQTGALVVPDEQTIRRALLLSPVVIVVCGIVSFLVSHGIYRRKEV